MSGFFLGLASNVGLLELLEWHRKYPKPTAIFFIGSPPTLGSVAAALQAAAPLSHLQAALRAACRRRESLPFPENLGQIDAGYWFHRFSGNPESSTLLRNINTLTIAFRSPMRIIHYSFASRHEFHKFVEFLLEECGDLESYEDDRK